MAIAKEAQIDEVRDYEEYVDGKPRYDGVASFLRSRGIDLEEGTEDDPADGSVESESDEPAAEAVA